MKEFLVSEIIHCRPLIIDNTLAGFLFTQLLSLDDNLNELQIVPIAEERLTATLD